jgi:hypothetical protein
VAKPAKQAKVWLAFQRAVEKLAKELGVPKQAYTLSKVKSANGKRSEAWKQFERQVAEMAREFDFKAERISRGADLGKSDVDIHVADLPELKIDCKYRLGGWVHHSIFQQAEKLYCTKPGDWLILPTKSGGGSGFFVTLRDRQFFEILSRAYPLTSWDESPVVAEEYVLQPEI